MPVRVRLETVQSEMTHNSEEIYAGILSRLSGLRAKKERLSRLIGQNCPQTLETPSSPPSEELSIGTIEPGIQIDAPNGIVSASILFGGHYFDWRFRRVRLLIEHYGAEWFKGKKILEIGCGHGDIGITLMALGADVYFLEGRLKHLEVLRSRYPVIPLNRLIHHNLNERMIGFPEFDLILNLGVLYHLEEWKMNIRDCAHYSSLLVVETEVSTAKKDLLIDEDPNIYDWAINGKGARPSSDSIANEIAANGYTLTQYTGSDLNSSFHRYDWKETHETEFIPGLRRLWFCVKSTTSSWIPPEGAN